MCAMKNKKLELLNKHNVSYCHGCLSSDRALSVLGELDDIFLKICILYPNKMATSQKLLCWECLAMLRKIKHFKARIIEAQKILHANIQRQNGLNTLSTLQTYTQNHTIEIQHTDSDTNDQKPEVKQEIDDKFEDTNDKFESSNDNFECLDTGQDLKLDFEDEEPDIKKVKQEIDHINKGKKYCLKKNQEKYYKLLFSKKMEELRRSFQIDPQKIESWREEDRNTEIFQRFKFKCVKCVLGWNSRDKFEKHDRKCHGEPGPFSCDLCSSNMKSKSSLRSHIASHSMGQECTECSYRCYSISIMNSHLNTHKDVVQCLICGAQMENKMSYYKHYAAVHRTFVCDHCGKSCKSKHMLERHISRTHFSHICKTCDKRYSTAANLRKHTWLMHERSDAELAYCAPCDIQFDTSALYKRHVSTGVAHASERSTRTKQKVPCPECDNVYSRKSYMMNHYRHVHMNQSKYYCAQCDRAFLNRTRYLDHNKYKHEGVEREKNKLCTICGRGFAATRTLVNHMRTHSGERPFECPKCGRRFIQKYAMVIHAKNAHGPKKT